MKDKNEMERMLEQVIVPTLRDGPHREQLRSELLKSTVGLQKNREEPWKANGRSWTTRLIKLAACVLVATLLFSSGWAAEKAYQWVTTKSYFVELEKFDTPPVTLSGGSDKSQVSMSSVSVVGTTIPEDAPPGSREKVKEHHELMKQLVAEKKYKFIKTFENPPGSQKEYLYRFTLPDGGSLNMNFSMRLENVASWEDYLQKSKEQAGQRNAAISRAIAAGKFRLLDVEPLTTHVCQDVGSNQRLMVLRVKLHDGKKIASVRGESADVRPYQMSWQDHLESVRQGDRVLLSLNIVKNYTYEITLQDRSKTIFAYGGDEPLDRPQG